MVNWMNLREIFWEIWYLPSDLIQEFICKVLDRCHIPMFGVCLYCGKEMKAGDYISWTEQLDPDNLAHSFLMVPEPLVNMLVSSQIHKKKQDAEFLWIEAHK